MLMKDIDKLIKDYMTLIKEMFSKIKDFLKQEVINALENPYGYNELIVKNYKVKKIYYTIPDNTLESTQKEKLSEYLKEIQQNLNKPEKLNEIIDINYFRKNYDIKSFDLDVFDSIKEIKKRLNDIKKYNIQIISMSDFFEYANKVRENVLQNIKKTINN